MTKEEQEQIQLQIQQIKENTAKLKQDFSAQIAALKEKIKKQPENSEDDAQQVKRLEEELRKIILLATTHPLFSIRQEDLSKAEVENVISDYKKRLNTITTEEQIQLQIMAIRENTDKLSKKFSAQIAALMKKIKEQPKHSEDDEQQVKRLTEVLKKILWLATTHPLFSKGNSRANVENAINDYKKQLIAIITEAQISLGVNVTEEQEQIKQQIQKIQEISLVLHEGFMKQIKKLKAKQPKPGSNEDKQLKILTSARGALDSLKIKIFEEGYVTQNPLAKIAEDIKDYGNGLRSIINDTQQQLEPVGCSNKFKNFLNKALDVIGHVFKFVNKLPKRDLQNRLKLANIKLTKRENILTQALHAIGNIASQQRSPSDELAQAPRDKPKEK